MRAVLALLVASLPALVLAASPALAQTKLTLSFTAAPALAPAYVAVDRGIFARHGLDVTLTAIAIGNNIPAALLGGSADIGTPTVPVLLQAADNGLDLVAVAGCEVYPAPYRQGILARAGIDNVKDLEGRKLATPGIGGAIDLLTEKYLKMHGVDLDRVTRIEVPLPSMPDALRSGAVDAVAVIDPIYGRIANPGIGHPIGDYASVVPPGSYALVYATTRDWAAAHADTLAAFRAALEEAAKFVMAPENAAASRESLARWTRLPPAVVQAMPLPASLRVRMKPEQIQFWIDIGVEFGLLGRHLDASRLVLP